MVFAGSLYFSTVARNHVSYGDSDEITTVGYLGGVAHPPGYPLLTFFTYVFTHLPFPGSIAFKANLGAMVIQVANLLLLYLISLELLNTFASKKSSNKYFCALGGALFTAVSPYFWLAANVIEKYTLLLTLFFMTVYFLIKSKAQIGKPIFFLLSGLCAGVGVLYHPIFLVTLIPFITTVFFKYRQKSIKLTLSWLSLVVVGITLSGLLLYGLNSRQVSFSFNFQPSFQGLKDHIMRSAYQSPLPEKSDITFHIGRSFSSALRYLQKTVMGLLIIPFLIAAYGWWTFLKKNKVVALWLGGIFLLIGPGLLFLTGSEVTPGLDISYSWYMLERFYVLSHGFLGIFISLGLFAVAKIRWFSKAFLVPGTIVCLLFTAVILHYPKVNLQNFTLSKKITANLLDSLPENSVLICDGDIATFSLLYQHVAEGKRSDIEVVPVNFRFRSQYLLTNPNLAVPSFSQNPEFTLGLIANTITKRPVFILDLSLNYYNLLGLTEGILFPQAYGQLLRIYPDTASLTEVFLEPVVVADETYKDIPFYNHLVALQAQRLALSGFIAAEGGQKTEAREYLTHALEIYPFKPYTYAQAMLQQLETYKTNLFITGEEESPTDIQLLSVAKAAHLEGNYPLAQTYAFGTLLKNPEIKDTHLLLQDIYLKLGDKKRSEEFAQSAKKLRLTVREQE